MFSVRLYYSSLNDSFINIAKQKYKQIASISSNEKILAIVSKPRYNEPWSRIMLR
jgi:hypothetical protein